MQSHPTHRVTINLKVKDAVSVLNYVAHVNRPNWTCLNLYQFLLDEIKLAEEAGGAFILETCSGVLSLDLGATHVVSLDIVSHNLNTDCSAFLIVQDQLVLKQRAETLSNQLTKIATPGGIRLSMPN